MNESYQRIRTGGTLNRRIQRGNRRVAASGLKDVEKQIKRPTVYGPEEDVMLILLILLVVLLFASAPAWPYSRSWGYYPSGTLGTILLILVVMMLLGDVPI